ncbi:MAG: hypothetical protein ACK4VO_02825 [Pseudobdellovibrio sp.]
MKKIFISLICLISLPAFAQQKMVRNPSQVTSYNSGFSQKSLGFNTGFTKGAINLGVTFDSARETGALGGYFFLQTEKKENTTISVYNTMAFGGHVHLGIFNQNDWSFAVRPGFGIAMVKDIPTTTGKSDETLIGPSLRWSFTRKISGGQEIGFEKVDFWNLFNTNANSPIETSYIAFVFRMPI